ncbi:hypothetical protein CS390_09270 [Pseudomonas sp. HLS-6]|uniref:hypothetical protein n=1 Tax=Pseudomonas sp. HLS-6 TaxID=2049589 RepID=UPI000C1A6580|nr:hypothetical protein [Pseudomonas sp. HLS-6]ATR82737.1 hypothetical protein CS390_09270 [Pseudomonas sp. HLS-6]
MSYFYKTESPKVLAAVRAWDEKKATWNARREKLGRVFGGAASPMYSGSRNYVGGIKLSASTTLDVHWCRPDEYGYRALRRAAKHVKGSGKEVRTAEKLEHQRLLDLWKEHCPDAIDRDEMWQVIGVNTGRIWMTGGVCFDHEGVVYLNLGCKAEAGEVDGLIEILASEYEAARQQVLSLRKAA